MCHLDICISPRQQLKPIIYDLGIQEELFVTILFLSSRFTMKICFIWVFYSLYVRKTQENLQFNFLIQVDTTFCPFHCSPPLRFSLVDQIITYVDFLKAISFLYSWINFIKNNLVKFIKCDLIHLYISCMNKPTNHKTTLCIK